MERIGCRLTYPNVFGPCREAFVKSPTFGAKPERAFVFLMLDENHRSADCSGFCHDLIDSIDYTINLIRGPLTVAKYVLNVDD